MKAPKLDVFLRWLNLNNIILRGKKDTSQKDIDNIWPIIEIFKLMQTTIK